MLVFKMNRMRYFITGTDTGVGKTLVASALLYRHYHPSAKLITDGSRQLLRPLKPVACGGKVGIQDGYPVQDDVLSLCAASDGRFTAKDVNPIFFPLPAAPTVAARAQNTTVELNSINATMDSIQASGDIPFVEGAGGLLVPLTEKITFADWAAEQELTAIIVSRAGLGTINHTVLALEAASRRNLPVSAVILNSTSLTDTQVAAESNCAEIARVSGFDASKIYILPYFDGNPKPKSELAVSVDSLMDLSQARGIQLDENVINDVRRSFARMLQCAASSSCAGIRWD